MNKILISLAFFATTLFVATPAFAQTACTPVYGGGQTCTTNGQLTINKTVKNPSTGQMVDNLGINDPKYSVNQTVPYQVTVTNTSGNTISNITVTDTFPSNIPCQSGPANCSNNQIVFTISGLNAGQSQTFGLNGKVVSSLPANQAIICDGSTVNTAVANASGQPTIQDTAQVCLQNQVLGAAQGGITVFPPPSVTATPKTGPEALALIAMIPTGALGALLRRKSGK